MLTMKKPASVLTGAGFFIVPVSESITWINSTFRNLINRHKQNPILRVLLCKYEPHFNSYL